MNLPMKDSGEVHESHCLSLVIDSSMERVDLKPRKSLQHDVSGLSSLKGEIGIGGLKEEASSIVPQRSRPKNVYSENERSLVDIEDEEPFNPRSNIELASRARVDEIMDSGDFTLSEVQGILSVNSSPSNSILDNLYAITRYYSGITQRLS
jgi:hypothetical protein